MGRDKALLPVAGEALAARTARLLGAAGAAPVVAIGGDGPALAAVGVEVVADRWPGEGPLGGLLTALRWSPARWVLVVACDMPWLTAATLEAIVTADPGDAEVVMAFSDRLEPLCARWDAERAAPVLQGAWDAGERAVRHAVRGLRVRRIELPDPSVVRDVDLPSDLPESWADRARERPAGA